MKARADKTKKLADYDKRLQDSKENIAVWMTQIKTVVDVSPCSLFFCHFLILLCIGCRPVAKYLMTEQLP
jgi:hypothetical protein